MQGLNKEPTRASQWPVWRLFAIFLVALAANQVSQANCQASDGDEQFQAYHHDIGRISGSASRAAVAEPTQTVLRQDQPLREDIVAGEERRQPAAHVASVAPASRARVAHQQRQHQQAAPAPATRKPNRITLAVRTHAPVQVSALGAEPPVVASQPPPVLAPPEEAPQQSPFTPLAGPSYRPSFQPLAPVEPAVGSSLRSSSSVSARHSALMAQVAAERGQQVELPQLPQHHQPQPQPQPQQPDPSVFAASQAPSSAVTAQVQPPPLLFQQQQQQQQAASVAAPALAGFVNRPEEPLVAPSFEQVLQQGCPQRGVFSWENKDYCDRYYMCTNGTFTEEACPNGLGYSQMGAVYQHCAYNWNVDCGAKKTAQPLASAGCPWQFGIFPVAAAAGRCSIDYYVCEWGVPETKRCSPEGLFYDDRIKGCQWADQLGCKSEALLNFKCPPEDEDNPYWPYPRYYHTKQDVIVCVNEQPRLVHCNEEQAVDAASLACMDLRPKKSALLLKKNHF